MTSENLYQQDLALSLEQAMALLSHYSVWTAPIWTQRADLVAAVYCVGFEREGFELFDLRVKTQSLLAVLQEPANAREPINSLVGGRLQELVQSSRELLETLAFAKSVETMLGEKDEPVKAQPKI